VFHRAPVLVFFFFNYSFALNCAEKSAVKCKSKYTVIGVSCRASVLLFTQMCQLEKNYIMKQDFFKLKIFLCQHTTPQN
jgi:hypothetical protein